MSCKQHAALKVPAAAAVAGRGVRSGSTWWQEGVHSAAAVTAVARLAGSRGGVLQRLTVPYGLLNGHPTYQPIHLLETIP